MKINTISLKDFKCFEEVQLDFGKITLLTGANSSGKSSLLSSILMMLQTEVFPLYLSTNGGYINLGGFQDIVYKHDASNKIELNVDFKKRINIRVGNSPEFETIEIESSWKQNTTNGLPTLEKLKLHYTEYYTQYRITIENSEYVSFSIEVLNPNMGNEEQESYKDEFEKIKETNSGEIKNDGILIGLHNAKYLSFEQFTSDIFRTSNLPTFVTLLSSISDFFASINKNFNFLHSYRLAPERNYLQKAKAKSKVNTDGTGYIDQITEWLETEPEKAKNLIENLQKLGIIQDIKIERIASGLIEIKVKPFAKSTFSSIADVGFGVSKILPILVAEAQLDNDSLLCISEPELDLHPTIQANFANHITNQINNSQRQYIIETHSEYLINRLRLLIAKGELKEEDIQIYYFENDGEKTTTHKVQFHKNGQITGAPESFFATYENDVLEIALNIE